MLCGVNWRNLGGWSRESPYFTSGSILQTDLRPDLPTVFIKLLTPLVDLAGISRGVDMEGHGVVRSMHKYRCTLLGLQTQAGLITFALGGSCKGYLIPVTAALANRV